MVVVFVRSHRAAALAKKFICMTSVEQRTASTLNQPSLPSSSNIASTCAIPRVIISHRCTSSTPYQRNSTDDKPPTTAELHSLYHDQMNEIQSEREAIFGKTDDSSSDSPDLSQAAKSYFTSGENSARPSPPSSSEPPGLPEPLFLMNPDEEKEDAYEPQFLVSPDEEKEAAYDERQEMFAFSEEEKTAWANNESGMSQIRSSHMEVIRQSLRDGKPHENSNSSEEKTQQQSSDAPSPFTHLTPQGDGVSMVDVGHKTSSRRVALARSVVVFPPEVMSEFRLTNNEMVGPKGPIFETAKIAGIMGAKKTSDLIPLCHPLPLDRVNINIQLINNQAIIECECRVTHKTGVEMEALTGATIAALTIYDMVKAVSHRVEIGQTVLVSKSGGKSDYVHN